MNAKMFTLREIQKILSTQNDDRQLFHLERETGLDRKNGSGFSTRTNTVNCVFLCTGNS